MIDKVIEIERIEDVINVFGSFDQNLRILEGELGVKVLDREDVLHVCGEPEDVILAEKAIGGLLTLASKGETINDQNVLPFRIDYIKTMKEKDEVADDKVWGIDTDKAFMSPENISRSQ